MYSAFVVTVAVKLPLVKSIVLNAIGITSFVVCQFYPSVMGIVDTADTPAIQSWQDFFSLVVSLVCIGSVLAAYRYAIEKWQESDATKKHINLVMSQMTNINAQLQEFAKNKGEQAAEEERMRITRDMHDSCGYVFVNIIGLMEACLSGREMEWSKTQETFETVRNLAKHGLQETRKTLRAIRDVESPVENSLDALFEIKSIFQKVTGISVDLDRGNMKSDYGRTINKILIRTMQEGLTNAVRHGLATYVAVFFREDGDYLFMTVKDNGIGSKQVVKGIGLAGMEERLAKVGGTLFAGDSADGGFKLEIQIPVVHLLMEEYGSEKTKTAAG